MQREIKLHFSSEEKARRFKESWEGYGMSIFKLERKGLIIIMTYNCGQISQVKLYPFSKCQHCG